MYTVYGSGGEPERKRPLEKRRQEWEDSTGIRRIYDGGPIRLRYYNII